MGSIVPGYDFTVNEVPTKAKFITAALGLTFDQVPLTGGIAEGMIFHLRADDSGASGANFDQLADGTLWTDPAGNIWVKSRAATSGASNVVPVKVFRAEGGFESSRFKWHQALGTQRPGDPLGMSTIAANTTESDVGYTDNNLRFNNNARYYSTIAEDTATSNGLRALIWGAGEMNIHHTFPPNRTLLMSWRMCVRMDASPSPTMWDEARFDVGWDFSAGDVGDSAIIYAQSYGVIPDKTSVISQASLNHNFAGPIWCWQHGMIAGPKNQFAAGGVW